MNWNEIRTLSELSTCPNCSSTKLTYTEFKYNRKSVLCTDCQCKVYESTNKLWYVVPGKEELKETNMEGYYEKKI